MFKLFVETTSRRARIVPEKSRPGIAERVFGELSNEDALANKDQLVDAVRGILTDKGIQDADLYTITLPDVLLPSKAGTITEDNKGPITENEKAHDDVRSPEELQAEKEGLTPEQTAEKQEPAKTVPKQEPAKTEAKDENKQK